MTFYKSVVALVTTNTSINQQTIRYSIGVVKETKTSDIRRRAGERTRSMDRERK